MAVGALRRASSSVNIKITDLNNTHNDHIIRFTSPAAPATRTVRPQQPAAQDRGGAAQQGQSKGRSAMGGAAGAVGMKTIWFIIMTEYSTRVFIIIIIMHLTNTIAPLNAHTQTPFKCFSSLFIPLAHLAQLIQMHSPCSFGAAVVGCCDLN